MVLRKAELEDIRKYCQDRKERAIIPLTRSASYMPSILETLDAYRAALEAWVELESHTWFDGRSIKLDQAIALTKAAGIEWPEKVRL